jgi:farnesyl-diphosphate farnesyltransferase
MNEKEILRRTSRSFYLTIRLLPQAVREEVALAYLLARATDTIADTSTAPGHERRNLLRAARQSLGRAQLVGYDASAWAGRHGDAAEQSLLLALPDLWRRMGERDEAARQPLITVLDHIVEGQIFDLERFVPEAAPLSDGEIGHYTYLVAGSVGEFWTDLCASRLRGFATEPREFMRERARHYGQALQLVNILRDRRMDAALGRVYLAEDQVGRWTQQARTWLQEGADYCAALRSGRLRYATLLPALLGWRTLGLTVAQPGSLITPAKVPRRELRQWMRRALPVWWSRAAVHAVARQASEQDQHHGGKDEDAANDS